MKKLIIILSLALSVGCSESPPEVGVLDLNGTMWVSPLGESVTFTDEVNCEFTRKVYATGSLGVAKIDIVFARYIQDGFNVQFMDYQGNISHGSFDGNVGYFFEREFKLKTD